MRVLSIGLAIGLAAAAPSLAASFRGFDLPSGLPICGRAIGSDGTVVGGPFLSVGAPPAQPAAPNFIYSPSIFGGQGRFSYPKPRVPGASVFLTGINGEHTVLGYGASVSGNLQFTYTPFKLKAGGTIPFALPGATMIVPAAIDNAGTVAGIFEQSGIAGSRGFLLSHGQMTVLDDGTGDTTPEALDSTAAKVVGYSLGFQTSGFTVWAYSKGVFTELPALAALTAFPLGVDRTGRITGTYFTGSPPALVAHGFVYAGGQVETLDVPGASYTVISGLNEYGQFTGCYTDGHGTHGLLGHL